MAGGEKLCPNWNPSPGGCIPNYEILLFLVITLHLGLNLFQRPLCGRVKVSQRFALVVVQEIIGWFNMVSHSSTNTRDWRNSTSPTGEMWFNACLIINIYTVVSERQTCHHIRDWFNELTLQLFMLWVFAHINRATIEYKFCLFTLARAKQLVLKY